MWEAVAVAIVILAQLVASRALRDGFFLAHFEPTALPSMVIGSSILSIAIVLGSTQLLRQLAPSRTLPILLILNGILFFVEWGLPLDGLLDVGDGFRRSI